MSPSARRPASPITSCKRTPGVRWQLPLRRWWCGGGARHTQTRHSILAAEVFCRPADDAGGWRTATAASSRQRWQAAAAPILLCSGSAATWAPLVLWHVCGAGIQWAGGICIPWREQGPAGLGSAKGLEAGSSMPPSLGAAAQLCAGCALDAHFQVAHLRAAQVSKVSRCGGGESIQRPLAAWTRCSWEEGASAVRPRLHIRLLLERASIFACVRRLRANFL